MISDIFLKDGQREGGAPLIFRPLLPYTGVSSVLTLDKCHSSHPVFVSGGHPLISHLTPALVARPDLLPCHSTPIIENTLVADQEKQHLEPGEQERHYLEPDRNDSRHHSISLSLHHSGSRHSLSSRNATVTTNQEKKEREKRKEARKAQSAQLPAHGEVQKMEASLLKLLNEFNSGQLRAFDSAYSLDEMESVRDKQEAIARKHFELGAAQDLHPPLSDEVRLDIV